MWVLVSFSYLGTVVLCCVVFLYFGIFCIFLFDYLVVSSSTVDWLVRVLSEMICYVPYLTMHLSLQQWSISSRWFLSIVHDLSSCALCSILPHVRCATFISCSTPLLHDFLSLRLLCSCELHWSLIIWCCFLVFSVCVLFIFLQQN